MRAVLALLTLLFAGLAWAQEEPADAAEENPYAWKLSLELGLNLSESGYSDNWAGEEEGQVSWLSTLNMIAEKQVSAHWNSRSTLRMEYGQNQTQDRQAETWSRPEKASDKIDAESVLRYTTNGFVDPYVAGRFESQFTDMRAKDTEFVNPITLTESAGIAKNLIKEEKREWITRLGFGVRQHIDRIGEVDAVTGERSSKTVSDAGFELVSELVTPVYADNIRLTAKLTVFQAIHNSEADELEGQPNEDYWQATDVDLETILSANITKAIMVHLNTRLLYDKEIDLAGRFKHTMSLGVTYTVF